MTDKVKRGEHGEKFVLYSRMKLPTCACLMQACVQVAVCESVFMSRSTNAQGDESAYLLRAALLLDFIKN